MSSPCPRLVVICAVILLAGVSVHAEGTLRVCADPNNLPFSDRQELGFENKLASLIATDMHVNLEYAWWSERKSFAKKLLDNEACDFIPGVSAGLPGVLTTQPYYRSSYVFVTRRDRNLNPSSLTDPRLAYLHIGVHVVGDDYAPPAVALAHQGITKNVVGFSLFGEYGEANPAHKLIDAVESGAVDVAIVWGPLAGYFAERQPAPLTVTAVKPAMYLGVPFEYDIAVAVRKGNETLKARIDQILEARAAEIQNLLNEYGVPQVQ